MYRLGDLSKFFYCLPYDASTAKLHAYEIELLSLRLLYTYIVSQKTKSLIEQNLELLGRNSIRGSTRINP